MLHAFRVLVGDFSVTLGCLMVSSLLPLSQHSVFLKNYFLFDCCIILIRTGLTVIKYTGGGQGELELL